MTYTVQEVRAAKIKLLKRAKRILKTEDEFFLCIALMSAADSNDGNSLFQQASYELRMYIGRVLNGNHTRLLDS